MPNDTPTIDAIDNALTEPSAATAVMPVSSRSEAAVAAMPAPSPWSLELVARTGLTDLVPLDDGEAVTAALQALGAIVGTIGQRRQRKLNGAAVDALIASIDSRVSAQVDEILHHPTFQRTEATWRGLEQLVDRTDFRSNIKIDVANASKDDLAQDFDDSPVVVKSGLYQHVYRAEYGQFGAEPYGVVLADYTFGPGSRDVELLTNCAAVSAMAHAPFIAAAGPEFFDRQTFEQITHIPDLDDVLGHPRFTKWKSFRAKEDARYVGLVLPRNLIRPPYDPRERRVKAFSYAENVNADHEHYLWGNAAYAFGATLNGAFAEYGWAVNIIGPRAGGTFGDLPIHIVESTQQAKIPTEVLIPFSLEKKLEDLGFISLTMRNRSDNACFFAAPSCQKPAGPFSNTTEGNADRINAQLGSQLPYVFLVSRLAHYIKVIQTENLGRNLTAPQLEAELVKWLKQYWLNMDVATDLERARRPLRDFSLRVEADEKNAGWYRVSMRIKPHFKYMGAFFEISLVGRLDLEETKK